MVQSHKILTVSYGTFSCTLEGFDDAFGTMKAIAEYFRDLAAEDRYFGAEPPQPDAEMLAHIAQKEIARRVDAHQSEGGIVLRAQDAAAVAAPAVAAEPRVEATEPAPEIAETPEVEVEDVSDAIAAELASDEAAQTEEAVVEDDDVPAEMEPVADEAEAESEEEPSAAAEPQVDEVEAVDVSADEAGIEEPLEQDVVEDIEEEGETAEAEDPAAFFAATETDTPAEVAEDVEPEPVAVSAADSIAAKLQRIRAVVSRGKSAEPAEDFTEDEHADAIDTPAETVDAKAKISALLNGQVDDAQDERTEDDDAEDAFLDDVNARLNALDPADASDMDEPVVAEQSFEDAPEVAAIAAEETLAEPAMPGQAEADDVDEADLEEEPSAPSQARVVKVSKEEFDAILASDRGEDLPTVVLTEDLDDEAVEESTLSAEDEEDLMRELAAVEAELGDDTDMDEAEDLNDDIDSIFAEAQAELDDEDAFEDLDEDRAILSADVDSDDEVSRLLDEADDKLSDSETSDRRSEFAHLRAAMAAGKAEEEAGGSMSEAASDSSYRDDLARVVKPRRPDSGDPRERSRRPQDEKPAPLKLVAAQRVDAEHEPVQPRRVMSSQVDDLSEDGAEGKMKFADYADSVGAHDLPDLLEAAAAYLSFVEGQEQFSRPQLMTKVRMVETEEFSREDGLRSFGLLLRDGKIEKTQAGRFTVSDRIGFRPEDMRAAG